MEGMAYSYFCFRKLVENMQSPIRRLLCKPGEKGWSSNIVTAVDPDKWDVGEMDSQDALLLSLYKQENKRHSGKIRAEVGSPETPSLLSFLLYQSSRPRCPWENTFVFHLNTKVITNLTTHCFQSSFGHNLTTLCSVFTYTWMLSSWVNEFDVVLILYLCLSLPLSPCVFSFPLTFLLLELPT